LATDWYSGPSGCGSSVTVSRTTTGAAVATLAHQRQRGEGSLPVGVNSRMKPMQVIEIARRAGPYSATYRAAGSAPGRIRSP
jgi:hypothetical protein